MSANSAFSGTCIACGHALSSGARFCPACGVMTGVPTGGAARTHTMLAMMLAGVGFLGLLVVMVLAFRVPSGTPPASIRPAPPKSSSSVSIAAPTPAPASPPVTVVSGMQVVRLLSDSRLGFQIDIPGDWVDFPDADGHSFSPPDDSADSMEIFGLIKLGLRGPGDTLKNQVDAARKELRDLAKLVIESETNVAISGHPAVKIAYHYYQPAAECTYFGVTVIVERPEGFCLLILHALEERRERYQPVFEQMIHRFRITPVANP